MSLKQAKIYKSKVEMVNGKPMIALPKTAFKVLNFKSPNIFVKVENGALQASESGSFMTLPPLVFEDQF